jgi:hypothetical protein
MVLNKFGKNLIPKEIHVTDRRQLRVLRSLWTDTRKVMLSCEIFWSDYERRSSMVGHELTPEKTSIMSRPVEELNRDMLVRRQRTATVV